MTYDIIASRKYNHALEALEAHFYRDAYTRDAYTLHPDKTPMNGNKPLVVCNGRSYEARDLSDAQAQAEELAHKHHTDAYIPKPVTKVSPKRDVITTQLK